MKFRNILLIVGISASTAIASVWGYDKWQTTKYSEATNGLQPAGKIPANYASFTEDGPERYAGGGVDFTAAASAATPAVVHIKTKISARTVSTGNTRRNPFADLFGDDDMFGDFFGNRGGTQVIPEQRASGSGVIISDDGYIVTNNHVIDNANEINVTLNNKQTYKAQLVGADPLSDLAILKITAPAKLPYMLLGNSDDVKLGQWVLAIGYPLTLDVTVTAGIVSAKARYLGINGRSNRGQSAQGTPVSPIESFIQTDAAVNQGNSGGALVDTDGKLIGINSAIASPTGSYAGYSYAIPVNIVKKIAGDLKQYGAVQRAYLGLSYGREDLSDEQKKEQGIVEGEGVYVVGVSNDGAAIAAGIQKGDIVTAINGVKVSSSSEMIEQIANYKPGDKITVTYKRGGSEKTVNVTLKNNSGNYEIVKSANKSDLNSRLGAELETFDKKKATQAGITGGVLVKKINDGVLKSTKMQDGFVITGVNGANVATLDELKAALGNATGIIRLEGVYPGYEGVFAYPLNLNSGSGQ